MEALEVCRALVDAEKEYYGEERHYAAKFVSTGESHDGLYWKTAASAKKSPIGPYLARAGGDAPSREPYHGYYYRILLTPNLPPSAGAEVGHVRAGSFAVLAFPGEYRSSGVMTFLVNEDGNAREKDLGENTAIQAGQITADNPDNSWKPVE